MEHAPNLRVISRIPKKTRKRELDELSVISSVLLNVI